MVLPLYLAMTDSEIRTSPRLSQPIARMGCHFSTTNSGLQGLPTGRPFPGMLVLDDRIPLGKHDPIQITEALTAAVDELGYDGLLLDWERPPAPASQTLAALLADTLPCPVGMPPGYGDGAVFLPPAPLHVPLADYLAPWQGREIWLEAALRQQVITVTAHGTEISPPAPADREGGFYHRELCCRFTQEIREDRVVFTLFDTRQTLKDKLAQAQKLGVTAALGLYQELGAKESNCNDKT